MALRACCWVAQNLCSLGLMTSLCLLPSLAQADQDREREDLSRISYELSRVQSMVTSAAKQAPTGQRIVFRYDWLARDLELMRKGLEEHLDAPQQPRLVVPLKGDYRQ
jgi:RAQPRD family integrative conjugative element protein